MAFKENLNVSCQVDDAGWYCICRDGYGETEHYDEFTISGEPPVCAEAFALCYPEISPEDVVDAACLDRLVFDDAIDADGCDLDAGE